MKIVIVLFISLLAFTSCKNASENPSDTADSSFMETSDKTLTIAETIANKYGYKNWNSVSELRFTFNVQRGDRGYARSWLWKPKSGDVMLFDQDTLSFNHNQVDSIMQPADARFINDKYWLLAPFNLIWDKGISFTNEENAIAPISGDTLSKLTVAYSDEGGYTPGDTYELFYDSEFLIQEWTYFAHKDTIPSLVNTWEDYETVNGILISKMHRQEDTMGGLRIFITDISIK